ncbi:MAG: ribosome recycling factor [Gammaproteobacteria bacterium]|nr:ribosome recycling factor [Gammaproteobacteria bacterium]
MLDEIKKEASGRMTKSLDALATGFAKVRTGRAHVSLLDQVKVSYYGNEVPLAQAATVSVQDARTLVVSPWEKSLVGAIEKAIMQSNLGLNPATSGTTIRVPLPALTEERRRDMIRIVRAEAETARVAIRNIRRDANSDMKALQKEKEISEDDEHRGQESVQKLTDKFIADVDRLLAEKETDLMEI